MGDLTVWVHVLEALGIARLADEALDNARVFGDIVVHDDGIPQLGQRIFSVVGLEEVVDPLEVAVSALVGGERLDEALGETKREKSNDQVLGALGETDLLLLLRVVARVLSCQSRGKDLSRRGIMVLDHDEGAAIVILFVHVRSTNLVGGWVSSGALALLVVARHGGLEQVIRGRKRCVMIVGVMSFERVLIGRKRCVEVVEMVSKNVWAEESSINSGRHSTFT